MFLNDQLTLSPLCPASHKPLHKAQNISILHAIKASRSSAWKWEVAASLRSQLQPSLSV